MARPRRGDGRAAGPVSRPAVLILRGVTAGQALVLQGWLSDVSQETALEARFTDFSEGKAIQQRGPHQTFRFDPPRAILNMPAGWSGIYPGGRAATVQT